MGVCGGQSYGIEVKSIEEVPLDGIVPKKSKHCFTKVQIRELNSICDNGGTGVGVVICGRIAAVFSPDRIDDNGQVNWHEANAYLEKDKGEWNLQNLWKVRSFFRDTTD